MSHQQNTAFFLLGSWTAQSGFFFFAPEAGKVHAHTENLYLVALEESSYFPLLHIVSKKRREDLMNKRCHFTLYDKSQEQQGKLFNTSYSGSCQPLSVQHTMLQQWKQGQPAFLRFFVVFFFRGWGEVDDLLVSENFLLFPFLTQVAISFPSITDSIFKAHTYYKTNRNKNLGGEGDGKVKKRHLHKRMIATMKYLPFAANNQRWQFPKYTLQIIFVINTSL